MGLIGVYGPNDDYLWCILFEELLLFMSLRDIPCFFGGDCELPLEKSTGVRLGDEIVLQFS